MQKDKDEDFVNYILLCCMVDQPLQFLVFFPCLVFLVFCLDRIKSSLWFWRGIYVGKKRSNVIMFVCVCTQKLNNVIFSFWVSKR